MRSVPTAGLAVGVAGYVSACGVAFLAFKRTYSFPSLGFGNAVTLVRLVCVCVLATALMDGSDRQWMLVGLAMVAFASDGVDGWLARRQGYASAFGARFDVEVDSAFALVLALLGFVVADAPLYVLVLGLPRYLFWAAVFAFPWLKADLPERFSRKVVCVIQIAALIGVLIPGLSNPFQSSLIALAALALAWSFAVDVLWLRRNHP
ncbi:MAG: CDP-alcohol phosphatidyltransferase family protein [Devosiaceae bacterium]|nr:CDP-alcohol phosphatidyltransferase family protein [Devosiaceae bacterium MH13]